MNSKVNEQFTAEVNALARRVVNEEIPLAEITLDVAGPDLARLMNAVRKKMIMVFAQIRETCLANGYELVIPAYRTRIATLFNMPEWRLDPLRGGDQEPLRTRSRGGEVRTISGQLLTQKRVDDELLLLGNIYINRPNGDFLSQARLHIERVFIGQCRNARQQRKIIEIVAGIGVKDLICMETVGSYVQFHLKQDIFQQLSIVSLLEDEDRHAVSRQVNAAVPVEPVRSVKRKPLSSEDIQAINLDWDELGWTSETQDTKNPVK